MGCWWTWPLHSSQSSMSLIQQRRPKLPPTDSPSPPSVSYEPSTSHRQSPQAPNSTLPTPHPAPSTNAPSTKTDHICYTLSSNWWLATECFRRACRIGVRRGVGWLFLGLWFGCSLRLFLGVWGWRRLVWSRSLVGRMPQALSHAPTHKYSKHNWNPNPTQPSPQSHPPSPYTPPHSK
jgi:hypothetical protein